MDEMSWILMRSHRVKRVPNSDVMDVIHKKGQYTDTQEEGTMCWRTERREGRSRKPRPPPLPPPEAGRGSVDISTESSSLWTSASGHIDDLSSPTVSMVLHY